MKILILQLARLGDIYLSRPAIQALKRANPQAQITLLTRPKFRAAASGLEAVHEIIELPTHDLFAPLVQDIMDVPAAHARLSEFIRELKTKNFDQIINLSFSPASSHLAHLLEPDGEKVRGYTRTPDGFLSIPDDMSAYFYAQVGPGKPNRYHLAEIFGTLCGVDLTEADWHAGKMENYVAPMKSPFIVCHIGASEEQKALSAEKWISTFGHFRSLNATPIVLIGSEAESAIADTIMSSSPTNSIVNLVGKTTLPQTMALLRQSVMLVGADSAPMHMASLTKTRCLNLSVGRVNFWETGPRAMGSWVLRANSEGDLPSDRVSRAMAAMVEKLRPELGIITVQEGAPSYSGLFPKEAEFHWKLTQAVYQGSDFPHPINDGFWQAHEQLVQINHFIMEQLQALQDGARLEEKAGFIDRGEEVIAAVAKLVPAWGPVIRWYQTEKIRIGPGNAQQVLNRTCEIQLLLQQVLDLYSEMKSIQAPGVESEAP